MLYTRKTLMCKPLKRPYIGPQTLLMVLKKWHLNKRPLWPLNFISFQFK